MRGTQGPTDPHGDDKVGCLRQRTMMAPREQGGHRDPINLPLSTLSAPSTAIGCSIKIYLDAICVNFVELFDSTEFKDSDLAANGFIYSQVTIAGANSNSGVTDSVLVRI